MNYNVHRIFEGYTGNGQNSLPLGNLSHVTLHKVTFLVYLLEYFEF